MNLRSSSNGNNLFALQSSLTSDRVVLDQESFQRMISLERKRTERSRKPFVLMLLDSTATALEQNGGLSEVVSVLLRVTRETDVVGWYQEESIVGVMFTEIGEEEHNSTLSSMFLRMNAVLQEELAAEQFDPIKISFHLFPEQWDEESSDRPSNPKLYPDLDKRDASRKLRRVAKRTMDILGSLLVLTLGSPVFLLIALLIKLTSKGPVFYRQQRVGQYGVPFSFLKFRSMYHGSDPGVHKHYVTQLIAGVAEKQTGNNKEKVYKLTRDPRITALGGFLRATSLDELPQFLNVLNGEMSLVGPRPPIDYEVERYHLWHRRRLLEAKPGITGLWQVSGRNRIGFDEMVRMDLHYAKTWSPWMDLQILLKTPKAMVEGAH